MTFIFIESDKFLTQLCLCVLYKKRALFFSGVFLDIIDFFLFVSLWFVFHYYFTSYLNSDSEYDQVGDDFVLMYSFASLINVTTDMTALKFFTVIRKKKQLYAWEAGALVYITNHV